MELENYRAKTPGDAFELELAALAEGSQKLYRRWFSNFLTFAGSTPDELIVFHEQNRGAVRRAVLAYQRQLVEEDGLHPNTAKFVGKAVSKFLSANDFTDFRMRDRSGVQSSGKLVLKPEQILSLYRDAGKSLRLKALVMTFKDTGFRPSDIIKMRVEDFNGARVIPTDTGEFRAWVKPILTQKNKVYAHVHLGPESVEALKAYIGDRTTGAIFLTERSMPHYTLNPDGTRTMNGESTQPGQPMKRSNISSCMKILCRPLQSQGFDVSAASFRKFFFTYLPTTNMDVQHCKVLAGKKLPPVDAPYIQTAQTGELTKLYIESYNALRIFKTTDTNGELETLRERIAKLESDKEITQIIQERRDGPVTQEQIQERKQIEELDARLPTTEEGWNRFFKELKKIEANQKQ